jgi:hypothetical protein
MTVRQFILEGGKLREVPLDPAQQAAANAEFERRFPADGRDLVFERTRDRLSEALRSGKPRNQGAPC